jgi:hypothetical protein
MSDNNETAQVIVNADPTWDQMMSGLRSFIVAGMAFALGRHWIEGDTATFLGGAVAFSTVLIGQLHTRHRAKQLANIASDPRVPDAVAIVAK